MNPPAPIARAFVIWLAILILAGGAWAAEPQFPALTGRVVDQAGILSAATRERLTEMLAAHEKASGEQVVIATLASLQGLPIEDFGYRLGRAWGIGEKGKNTGALLIIAPKDREVRIEVGYGLEGRLTDAISRAIIERDIVPAFRRGDFDRGVVAGTKALLGALGGEPGAAAPLSRSQGQGQEPEDNPFSGLFLLAFILIVVFGMFRGRNRSWIGPMAGGIWSSGGRSSGDGGFGGFSGGGGSFGGGGASGRW